MREGDISLPSIEPRRLFMTEHSAKRFSNYSNPRKSRDRSEIFYRYMDSSIIKKVNSELFRLSTAGHKLSQTSTDTKRMRRIW